MRFSIDAQEGPVGPFTWRLFSGPDVIAWAGESFRERSLAREAAREFRRAAGRASYETYLDLDHRWRWRAWQKYEQVAACGDSFYSKQHAERAAANVRDFAGLAEGT